jgi:hypothetical protein
MRLSVGLVGCALIATVPLISPPAQATTRSATSVTSVAAATPCVRPANRLKGRAPDTEAVSDRVQAEVASVLRTADATSAKRSALADTSSRATASGAILVPVLIHVIKGRHKGEHRVGRHAARRVFRTLKAGYAGAQDSRMAATGVRFKLRKITISRNDRWFHAIPGSRADRQMKSRLHRGRARVLNIYVSRPRIADFLGFSTFPWQHRGHKAQDGVTISDISLPGGRARGYNLGDTVIHESGHWFGLYHTFQGGCAAGAGGDGVADTPAEAYPSVGCPAGRNTCVLPEYADPADPTGPPVIDPLDPIHNFLDYSYDACMYQFTPGQSARMLTLFAHYRAGR